MRIVIAESMEAEVIGEIKKLGEIVVAPSNLFESLRSADVLIVRSATKVNAELLSHAPNLKLVARAGVGLDNVDVEVCARKKIKVVNTPGASSNAVAELAVGMMFAFARKIAKADASMKSKTWIKKELTGFEIQDKTIGIVGLGRIGSMLAIKARAIGMNVLYYDPRQPSSSAVGKSVGLDELMASSDFISLHVPLTPQTKGLINAPAISRMKPSAVIINTARGGLIDEESLYEAIKQKKIAGAALDVYPQEPYNGKLCELDNVVLTPHIGGSTKEAQVRIGIELVDKLKQELG